MPDVQVAAVEPHNTAVVSTEDSVVDVGKVVFRHGLGPHVYPRFDSDGAPSGVEAFVEALRYSHEIIGHAWCIVDAY